VTPPAAEAPMEDLLAAAAGRSVLVEIDAGRSAHPT
jgi:hypothetical protein